MRIIKSNFHATMRYLNSSTTQKSFFKSIRLSANVVLDGQGGRMLYSGEARGRQNFIFESKTPSDSPSLQSCTVCFGAIGRNGPRQRVILNGNLMFDFL